jgi:DNA-binding CsgD family transcriptional regulator
LTKPLTPEALNALVGDIYECVLSPSHWDETLTRLVFQFSPPNWDVAMLMWEGLNKPSVRWVGASGLVAHAREAYANVFAGMNIWSSRAATVPLGEVFDTDELVSREAVLASDLYQNFLKTWGLELALIVVFERAGDEQLGLVMPGPDGRDLSDLRRGLRLVAPHVQRAMRLSHGLAAAKLRAASSEAILNLGHVSVFALREDLSVVSKNARAEALVSQGLCQIDRGRFAFADRAAQRQLVELAKANRPTSLALSIEDTSGASHAALAITIRPPREAVMGGWVEGAKILLSISRPYPTPLIEVDRLRAWFNFTASEARLAAELSAGRTLQDFAETRGITIDAVRYLLKGTFRKTGAKNQAQLVALIKDVPSG